MDLEVLMSNNQRQEQQEHPKEKLLIAYKKAVQEKNANQAIEILKQLDHYLSKTEAAELMKSASEMFHRKLQTLGVNSLLLLLKGNGMKL